MSPSAAKIAEPKSRLVARNAVSEIAHEVASIDPLAPIPFERRAHQRHEMMGELEAVRTDGLSFPATMRLKMIDESVGGVAARVDAPVPPGARLSVRTCPITGQWRHGVVVRCYPSGDGYRLGIAFERRRAA
jgi:hypothetical protein